MTRGSWLLLVPFLAACSPSTGSGNGEDQGRLGVVTVPRVTSISIQGPASLCGGRSGTYTAILTGAAVDPSAVSWRIDEGAGSLSETSGASVVLSVAEVAQRIARVVLVATSTQNPNLSAQLEVRFGNQWPVHFATPAADVVSGVVVDTDGNIVVAGFHQTYLGTNPAPPDWGGFVYKLDPSGSVIWQQFLGIQDSDFLLGAALGPGGEIFVAGTTVAPESSDQAGFVAKFDPAGNFVWRRTVGGPPAQWVQALAVSRDGTVAVTGYIASGSGADVFVATFGPDGSPGWTSNFGGAGFDYGWSIAIDSRGEVTLTGGTSGVLASPNVGAEDAFVAHLDSNGQLVWVQQFGTPENDLGIAVAIDPDDDSAYVTGGQHQPLAPPWDGPPDTSFMFIVRIATDGTTLWRRELGSLAYESGKAVAPRPQGGVYTSSASQPDGMVRAWDASGEPLWHATPADPMVSSAMAVAADGSLYVGGMDWAVDGSIDAVVVKFDSNGVEQCF